MKKVRKRAKPIITWLGGICIVPIDRLSREKTMIIRVKEVKVTRMAGAKEITVSRRSIWMAVERFWGFPPPREGRGNASARGERRSNRGITGRSPGKRIDLSRKFLFLKI